MKILLRYSLSLFFTYCLANLFTDTAFAQTSTMRGIVRSIENNTRENTVLAGVKISLLRTGTNERVAGAVSNATGEYNVVNVPPGSYDIQARLLGHKDLMLLNVEVLAGQMLTKDLTLIQTSVGLGELVVTASRQSARKL
jgi:iron complex outermembrane recepter protein